LPRARQRTRDDQFRFQQASEWNRRFHLRASLRIELDWIAAHHPAFAVPGGLTVAHKECDSSHPVATFQLVSDVKRSQRHEKFLA
jgi:hypothetical protein